MVEFEEICLETLIAATQKHQQYLNSNKANLENQQKFLSQSAIIQQVWSQVGEQEGYRSKFLFGEVFRALEDREWLKSKTGKRRAKLYFPTNTGMEVYRNFASTNPEYAATSIKRKPEVQILGQIKSMSPKTSDVLQTLSNYFQHSLQAEQTLSKISARLISFSNLDKAIQDSLADIGRLFQADRVFLIDFFDSRSNHSKQYEWRAPGFQPVIEIFENIPIDWFPLSFRQSKSGGNIWHSHVDDLREQSAVDKDFLQQLKSSSFLVLPLFREERFSGVLGIADALGARTVSEEEICLFRVCTEILSTALAREKMSFALNQRVKALKCLYEIDELARKTDLTLKRVFKKIIELLLPAWQYPDLAGACITYEGEHFATKSFGKRTWTQSTDVIVKGEKKGSLTISYGEDLPVVVREEGPFLREEIELLEAIAERIAIIIESKLAEMALSRTQRALAVLSGCNRAIARCNDEVKLLEEVCQIITEKSGYIFAWVGMARDDSRKSVEPVAQAGFDSTYFDSAKITWDDNELGHGPTGTAIRTGRPSLAKNSNADPNYNPWLKAAEKQGFASSIALPLIANGKAFGALNICSEEPDAYDEEELELLGQLADDLAYGISALRTRVEHKRARKALHESEEKYRLLVEQMQEHR
ncbi:MAG: GAF domain-containing protein [Candidatus Hodarchaeota archaeon]